MEIKQEHTSSGDNVARDKIENTYHSTTEINSLTSKISTFQDYRQMDFNDDIVLKAFKETVVDFVKEEQQKSHNIVPIGHIRNYYRNYIEDELFETTMKNLHLEKSVEINKVQVCYVPKDLNYSIEF